MKVRPSERAEMLLYGGKSDLNPQLSGELIRALFLQDNRSPTVVRNPAVGAADGWLADAGLIVRFCGRHGEH